MTAAVAPVAKGPPRTRLLRRVLAGTVLLVGLPTVLIGLAHTRAFGPSLGRLFGMGGGCPVSLTGLTAEQIDAHRAKASVVLAGAAPSQSKRAGPFVVGTTTRADVEAWATREGVAPCKAEQSGTALRCVNVPARGLTAATSTTVSGSAPRGQDVFLKFSPTSVLVGVDIMREPCDGACVEALARDLDRLIERDVGKASARHGEVAATYLDAAGTRMAKAEYRFTDFAVDVSVSRYEPTGPLTLREQYRAVDKAAP